MEPLLGRPGPVLQVCFPAARASVLEQLNRQREEGQLCDLSIQVQGQVFRAHRCVLAASSPYFHDQVLLKNVTTVSLPSVMDPLAFESVLNSAYTGQLSIVRDDIINYVTVASFLQMWHIVDKCTDILKRSRPLQASPGTASQQSPSSSDGCLAEPEEQRPPRAALPPLATWRRPTQSRWSRGALSFPLRVESECGSDAIPTPPLPCLAPAEADVPARPRIRVRLRGPPEDERRVEADEGVGELPDEDKVRVKCEEPQAGRLRESEAEAEAESLWQSVSDWPLPEEDEGGAEGAANPLRPPASPSPCSPLSATPKVHFCHCGKAYTLKSMRDRHVKMTHLNLRPFACPVCSKTFKMKHHLTKHVKTHGGLRPYECALCGKKIVWRDSFLKHQARCQRGPAAPEDVKQEWDEPALPEDDGQT